MKQNSLRLRLLAGAGIWITLALIAAGAAIVFLFSASVERDQHEDLLASLDRVIARLDPSVSLFMLEPDLGDARYQAPAGGLYWQVRDMDTGDTVQSRSLWDFDLAVPAPARPGEPQGSGAPGPQGQSLWLLTQDVLLEGSGGVQHLRATVAEDLALRGRDIRQFSLDLTLALALVGLALIAAAWLQVYLGLRPLTALRQAVEAVTRGRTVKLEGSYPSEVQPLVEEVNALLDAHERSITFARARADDLAHGLKTPLAVLSATAERLRTHGDVANADVLELLSAEMADRIDYQLRLAQLRVRTGDRRLSASLDQALLRSVAVLRKTGNGANLFWRFDADKLSVDMDPHDLLELIGVLLENAANWARSQVEISCRAAGAMAEFEVSDDGPGLSEDEIAQLGPRGRRLDEQRSGNGFGIAIAREILDLNGGSMHLSRSLHGGLRVLVCIRRAAQETA